jgi:hypothetical protein
MRSKAASADVLRADPATRERVKVLVPFGFTERAVEGWISRTISCVVARLQRH